MLQSPVLNFDIPLLFNSMKSIFPCLAGAVFSQLLAINMCSAQSDKIATLQPPPSKIIVDGDIKEWGDSLRYYNSEKKLNYAIANTKDTLYMAIRISDRSEQKRVLGAGLTFSMDPKGKKKETFSITFPLNLNGNTPLAGLKEKDEAPGDITKQDRDDLMRERITTLRGIKAVGFKDVEDEMMTTSNTYGFQTAVNYDENGYLVCEAAIPMSFFHIADPAKSEWAFNFRINGMEHKPRAEAGEAGEGNRGANGMGSGGGRSGGRGGRGGGSHNSMASDGEGHDALFKTEDFWEKFYLAK